MTDILLKNDLKEKRKKRITEKNPINLGGGEIPRLHSSTTERRGGGFSQA